jgi:hypothetical protein
VLPSLNKDGALRGPIRLRWIGLLAVQVALLWSIPQTGADLPQPGPAAIASSNAGGFPVTGFAESRPSGKSLLIFRNCVKPRNQKYSAFVLTQISGITPRVSPDRGALAIVTNVR